MDYLKAQRGLGPVLKPLSLLYGKLMQGRSSAYAGGLLKSRKPKVFTISVGNISWGGSGKTPLVDWLLHWSEAKGLRPAVLTRGYGGKSEARPLPVRPTTRVEQSGDEALMLSRAHPEAFILADPVRARAVDWLEQHSTANIYILDDGMQHLAVQRDLNLVLLREKDLGDEWNKVIPAGSWREPWQALERADAFMLRSADRNFESITDLARQRLAGFGKPLFSFDLRPSGLRLLRAPGQADQIGPFGPAGPAGRAAECAGLPFEGPYLMCAAVGSPDSVRNSLMQLLGREPAEEIILPDHHLFSEEDLQNIRKAGLPVIVTAKDAVKIEALLGRVPGLTVYVLEAELSFGAFMFSGIGFEIWLDGKAADFM